MKQVLYSFAFTLFSTTVFATIRTVSNNPTTIAQFNTIQAAIDAASSGDTIYIHGSPNAYAFFTQNNKRLIFIGPGFTPDKNLGFIVNIPGCNITGASSGNSEYHGLVFTSTLNINSNRPNGLKFMRNQFANLSIQINQGGVTYSDYVFESNLFDNSSVDGTPGTTYQNFLFQNNYFYESGCCRSGNITGFSSCINVLLNHNLWYGPGSGIRDCFANSCSGLIITNNIFVRRNAATSNSNSVFNNNITFYPAGSTAPADPWTVNGNVNAGSNVSNQDPQMAAQASVNAGTNNALLDFTIAAGPANNSGSDGKDMGLLFDATGSLNWTNSRNSRIPRIFSMNITTPTVPAGGNVSVTVESRTSN
jgi:hypothetical protein